MTDSQFAPYSLDLMPRPLRVEPGDGPPLHPLAPLRAELVRIRTPRLTGAVARCLATCATDPGAPAVPLSVDCAASGARFPGLDDDEAYTLTVSGDGVHLAAAQEWGVLRGLATLTQLRGGSGPVPPLRVVDAPRFAWRGLMLDVARHFLPAADLLRTLDTMAVFKLNVLHLHLSDDQGFRFPSRRFPRLPTAPHYSRGDLETLIGHAADRGIRVVPELDVPGHAASWLEGYPEWGCRAAKPSRRFGVHQECLDPTRPEVMSAVEAVFAELAEVFPDAYLHLGGDEVHPAWWGEDPQVGAFMAANGLAGPGALQAWFNRRLSSALARLGRRALGWDEVLHDGLPPSVAVQAWRGSTARDRALAAGHDCVFSAPYYLDLQFPADVHYRFDPGAPLDALLALEDGLLEEPRLRHVAAGMAWTLQWRDQQVNETGEDARTAGAEGGEEAGVQRGRLLGAEACLWSELVDSRVLDVRLWSRMPALAERFWSPASACETEDLYRRLPVMLERLPAWSGVDVPGDAGRLAAEAGVDDAWQPLVEMLEPVKWYGRLLGDEALAARLRGRELPKARPYDADTPLNRVVDAVPPESLAVRTLSDLLRAQAAGDAAAGARLRERAQVWQRLPERGGPAELVPCAVRLKSLGTVVEGVLDGTLSVPDARKRLQDAAAPIGEYLLAPVFALDEWLDLLSGAGSGSGRRADRGHD